jgi:hypothetical protein
MLLRSHDSAEDCNEGYGRDRTCNLLIRSQAPCHWATQPGDVASHPLAYMTYLRNLFAKIADGVAARGPSDRHLGSRHAREQFYGEAASGYELLEEKTRIEFKLVYFDTFHYSCRRSPPL